MTIAWQGGEPTLMGVDFFRRAMAVVEQHRRPGQTVQHTMQTNGTLLTDEWCELLARARLPGRAEHRRPGRAARRLPRRQEGQPDPRPRCSAATSSCSAHHVDTNILCTVNAANQDHPLEVYRYFRDELGAPFTSSSSPSSSATTRPGFQEGDQVTDRSVDPEAWGRFLIGVFDEWVRRDVGTVFVQMFDAALAVLARAARRGVHLRRDLRRRRWRSSTTATCTPATTSSSPSTCSATS